MIALRSLLFNACFFSWSLLASLIFIPLFIFSPRLTQRVGGPWGSGVLLLARLICGIRYEVRGRENLSPPPSGGRPGGGQMQGSNLASPPPQPSPLKGEGDPQVIFACKHQSAWDTMIFLVLFKRPAYILKKELLRIPGWGWYLWRMKMIAIDRSGKASSLKHMIKQAKAVVADGRPIVIFPEGTRMKPGAEPNYHPGVVALYSQMGLLTIPVALNSGVYWGKNAFMKRPGTIVIEFLPPIAPGMKSREFGTVLQETIETASQRLLAEAQPY